MGKRRKIKVSKGPCPYCGKDEILDNICFYCGKMVFDRDLQKQKRIIIGGDFGIDKSSSIIDKLSDQLNSKKLNGGTIDDLNIDLSKYDLIIWAPNVNNKIPKQYPRKKKGAVLICTKVLREDRDWRCNLSYI